MEKGFMKKLDSIKFDDVEEEEKGNSNFKKVWKLPLSEFKKYVSESNSLEDIAKKYAARGRNMTPSNRKQALIPEGAEILPNPTGTAPGIIWQPREGLTIFTFHTQKNTRCFCSKMVFWTKKW